MTRSTPEWIADHDDQAIPTRVKLRVFERAGGRCAHCGRKIGPADKWQCDHIVALVNSGRHAEGNLQPLCPFCHQNKTAEDVAFKAKSARIRARHLGIRPPSKWQARPLGYGNHQHTATRPIIRVRDINED